MSKPPHSTPGRPRDHGESIEVAFRALQMQRPDEAERLALDVLGADPGNVLAAQALGHALLRQSRPRDAIEPLEAAVLRTDDPTTETLLARVLAAAGRRDEAFEQLNRTTARRPPFPLAFLELGDQLGDAGRDEEAVAVFEAGIALAPDAAVLRMGLGHLQLKRNDRAAARGLFSQVQASAPERHDVLIALAKVTALDGEYDAASDLYRKALRLRPDDPVTRISLGRCLLEMGERDEGEAALRAATRGATQLTGLALTTLAAAPHGRFFLRPSAARRFLQAQNDEAP